MNASPARVAHGRRAWWRIYAIAAGVVLASVAWVSVALLDLEASERQARSEAQYQSTLRLALWRLDSWMLPLLARESSRPSSDYEFSSCPSCEIQVPSPLTTHQSDYFRLHFQVASDGNLTSPQLPQETMKPAVDCPIQQELIIVAFARMEDLFKKRAASSCMAKSVQIRETLDQCIAECEQQMMFRTISVEMGRSQKELAKRQDLFLNNLTRIAKQATREHERPANTGPLLPLWFADSDGNPELLFIRRAERADETLYQGILSNWPALKDSMLAEIADLFPVADLVPTERAAQEDAGSLMATLPIALEADNSQIAAAGFVTTTRTMLGISWIAVLLCLGAVAVSLRSTVDFAEKRARFATAVTHELRTPLTTFRMYTEMLTEDMVPDEGQKRQYLQTLREESERLSRLVENVLFYSQLEEGRRKSRVESISVADLLNRLSGTLVRRAESEGLSLEIDVDACASTYVETDVDAVGQILFNLVDNACKYAGANTTAPLRIRCQAQKDSLSLRVIDSGSGVAKDQVAMIFVPFERGSAATEDRPGIGIGLALSRGLARNLGGELDVREIPEPGACFELTLPLHTA